MKGALLGAVLGVALAHMGQLAIGSTVAAGCDRIHLIHPETILNPAERARWEAAITTCEVRKIVAEKLQESRK